MKRVSRLLLKTSLIVVFNIILFFILFFVMDNMPDMIIRVSLSYDIKDWWYEQNLNHMVYFLIVTAVYSGILYFINSVIELFVSNKITLFVGSVVDLVLLMGINHIFWIFVWSKCLTGETTSLEMAISISYENQMSATILYDVYIVLLVLIRFLTKYSHWLIDNKRIKVVSRQVFSNSNIFNALLYLGVPYMVVISGTYFIVGFLRFQFKNLILIPSVILIIFLLLIDVVRIYQLNFYYKDIEANTEKRHHLVIFQESGGVKDSYIMKLIFGNGLKLNIKNKGIYLYPLELGCPSDVFIKLDIYDEWMFLMQEKEKKEIIQTMTAKRGAFNIAYNLELDNYNKNLYDACYDSIDKLKIDLLKYDEYMIFKNQVLDEMEMVDLGILNKVSCISEEIEFFKQYLIRQTTNQFIMFDLSIKWMEIINYFFSITMLDVLRVNAREYIMESDRIDYADFKKWRDVFDYEISKYKSFKFVNEYEINIEIFKIFNSMWELVTSRSYDFHSYTVQELLEACNYLRDYTRGHGVFTFEISQYINLNLLKILVALLNSLIYFLRTTDMKDNLESLGWVIYLGDIPYFLYSVGRRDSNVTYKSFRKGNSLSLPIDIYGESDEK